MRQGLGLGRLDLAGDCLDPVGNRLGLGSGILRRGGSFHGVFQVGFKIGFHIDFHGGFAVRLCCCGFGFDDLGTVFSGWFQNGFFGHRLIGYSRFIGLC